MNARVALRSLAVHPGDGATGKDVVKLQEKHLSPQGLQLHRRIRCPPHHACVAAPVLGLTQQRFTAPVILLELNLSGCHTAVSLQIELPHPNWRMLILGLGLGKKGMRIGELHAR